MEIAKRTYALPAKTLARFENKIAPGKRSAKIAEIIEAWMRAEEREALKMSIIEGCRDMSDVNLEVVREWEGADDELACTVEP